MFYVYLSAFQALCECALHTPYDSLKLGMLSVLSTLSGTIAIKHYFSVVPGKAKTCNSWDELAYPVDLRLKGFLFVFNESFVAFLLLPFPIT